MTIVKRTPTGLPSWPITLVDGMPSAGKSFLGAQASSSSLLAETFWISFGEKDPDELAAIPGAVFSVIEHDGTVRGVVRKIEEIAALPVPDVGVNLIVVDSVTPFWRTIGEEVRLAKTNRSAGDDTSDFWVDGKGDWQSLLNALRAHRGPSIITARLEETPVFVDGRPTRDRTYRVLAERNLEYDVDVVVEMPVRGEYVLRKANSAALAFGGPRAWPDFTMHALWEDMGLAGPSGPRSFTVPVAQVGESQDTSGRNWIAELAQKHSAASVAELGREAAAAKADPLTAAAIRKKMAALTPMPPTDLVG